MTKRKYKQGRPFTGLADYVHHCNEGGWVWYRGKAYSPKWAMPWSLVQVGIAIRDGTIRKAVAL